MPPTQRQSQGRDIPIPDIADDAAERKRVLNVLAQRRYRKRKRDRLAALESKLKDATARENTGNTSADSDGDRERLHGPAHQEGEIQAPFERVQELPMPSFPSVPTASFSELGLDNFEPEDTSFQEDFLNPADETLWPSLTTTESSSSALSNPRTPPSSIDPSLLFPTSTANQFPSSSSSSSQLPPDPDLSTSLQDRQTSTFSFPDDYLLTVLELDLLRAALSIATRLNIGHLIWNLEAASPFCSTPSTPGGSPSICPTLPRNLIPTCSQRHLAHHPILDLLPWPSARDKLIRVFSQPLELRPPSAADPMSLVQLVYDMEDSAEGIRIWGSDPCDGNNWEVGQCFFERWWWALDGGIVGRSNEWRAARGAGRLRLKGSFAVGTAGREC